MPGPPIPPGMSRNDFGAKVMQWGAGHAAALARRDTITRAWLQENGVTLEVLEAWAEFYEGEDTDRPGNPSARGHAVLVRHCMGLIED